MISFPFSNGTEEKKCHKGLKLKPGLGESGWGGEALIAESYFSSKCSHLSEPWKNIGSGKPQYHFTQFQKRSWVTKGKLYLAFVFAENDAQVTTNTYLLKESYRQPSKIRSSDLKIRSDSVAVCP